MLEKSVPLNRARNSHFYSVGAQTSSAQEKSRRKLGRTIIWKQQDWQTLSGRNNDKTGSMQTYSYSEVG